MGRDAVHWGHETQAGATWSPVIFLTVDSAKGQITFHFLLFLYHKVLLTLFIPETV